MTLVQALTSEPRAPGNCRTTLLPKPRALPAVDPMQSPSSCLAGGSGPSPGPRPTLLLPQQTDCPPAP